MKFEKLEEELTYLMLHAFIYDKIVNKEKIVDPTIDPRCRFTKQEFNEWTNCYSKIQELYDFVVNENRTNNLQEALRATR